ncbi:MAG TPA: hypothetical protein VFA74_05370 [Terriglobales bacterium]|nr:hypothetical protein [Terriglobales bacterium]
MLLRGILFTFAILLVCLLFSKDSAARAPEPPKPTRIIDLKNELCAEDLQQYNIPITGADFISNDELLVYTVCRIGSTVPANRDKFQASDLYHLKAVIVDLKKGVIERRFDWPTHGKGSGVRITHAGDLLLHRDNVLDLISADGHPIQQLQITRMSLDDNTFVSVSPTIDTIAVSQGSETATGPPVTSAAVYNSRNLHLLQYWRDNADVWSIGASTGTAVRSALRGKLLVMRKLSTGPWKTMRKENAASIGVPVFIDDDEFAVPARDATLLYTTDGQLQATLRCSIPFKAIVSREANALGAVWVKFAGHNPDPGRPKLTDAGIDIYRLPSLLRVTSIPINPPPSFGFDAAISPSGSKLAIVDHLSVSVFEIAHR